MTPLIALVLAAAVPQTGAAEVRPQTGAQATVRATAEVLRAETSNPDPGEGGAQRQVRRRAGGQIAVEFE
jgi:hypothetical protein